MSDYLLKIELTPEALELLRTLPQAPARAARAMAKELDLQNELTIGYAQRNKLSGPRPGVLGVVTNRLRGSLRRSQATVSGTLITGAIGSNVQYAAVHEYGFDGNVQVQSFVRRTRSRDVRNRKGKITANGISFVKAFTRHMHMPERSFVRSSISERLPQYNAGLSRAVLNALGGSTP